MFQRKSARKRRVCGSLRAGIKQYKRTHFETKHDGGLVLLFSRLVGSILPKQVKQMRAMEAELGMYKQQVDLFKSDIEAANEAMRALRHRWVAQQRRNKGNERGGGADETTNTTTASAWESPSPAPATAVSADSIPLLLQDGRGGSSSGKSVEKGMPEGEDTPEMGREEGLPAVAAG